MRILETVSGGKAEMGQRFLGAPGGAFETGSNNTIGPHFRGPNLRWRVGPRGIRSDREMKKMRCVVASPEREQL